MLISRLATECTGVANLPERYERRESEAKKSTFIDCIYMDNLNPTMDLILIMAILIKVFNIIYLLFF